MMKYGIKVAKKKISVKFLTNTMEELTDHGNYIYTGNLKCLLKGFREVSVKNFQNI